MKLSQFMRSFPRWHAAILTYGTLLAISIAPLFLGLNRPIYWLGFTLVIAGLLTSWVVIQGLGRAAAREWPMGALLTSLCAAYAAGIILPPMLAMVIGEDATPIVSPLASIAAAMRILGYMLLSILILLLRPDTEQILRATRILIGVMVLYAFYGLAGVQSPDLLWHGGESYTGFATGPFVNRNSFATFLAMGACLSTAYAMRLKDGNRARRTSERLSGISSLTVRMVPWSSTILFIAATLATGSRMGTFVLFLGIAVVVALSQSTRSRDAIDYRAISISLLLPLLAFALSMVFIAISGGTVLDRVGSIEQDFSVRMALYVNMISAILAQPFIGVGLDGFEQGFKAVQDLGVSTDVRWDNGHNTYLENWFELGLLVGSLPIMIAIAALRILLPALRARVPNAFILIASVAMILVVAIHSLVDFSLEMPAITALLVYITSLGFLVAQRGLSPASNKAALAVADPGVVHEAAPIAVSHENSPQEVIALRRRMAMLRNDGKL